MEAHWDQTKNMQNLFHEEETLLYHQPDMVRKAERLCHLCAIKWGFDSLIVFAGIWRVYTQAAGGHGKKGQQCEQRDCTSTDIPDGQSHHAVVIC